MQGYTFNATQKTGGLLVTKEIEIVEYVTWYYWKFHGIYSSQIKMIQK
jgi:hypothetical protein